MESKITIEQVKELAVKINNIPPILQSMEMSSILWTILQRNIEFIEGLKGVICGVNVVIVENDKEIGINKVRFKFDKGEDKIITAFNFNYDFKYNMFNNERGI